MCLQVNKLGQSDKRSCVANALRVSHFMQVQFSPSCTHLTFFTPDKHRTSRLEAFLMDRGQKENLTIVFVCKGKPNNNHSLTEN